VTSARTGIADERVDLQFVAVPDGEQPVSQSPPRLLIIDESS
jgi:hypothetical protein